MYGVLYAISPELFPTKDRGTGNAIVATANRIFGVMASPSVIDRNLNSRAHPVNPLTTQAPIIALYANLATSVPIWIAGAIFIVSGFIALLLPYEPRGHASL